MIHIILIHIIILVNVTNRCVYEGGLGAYLNYRKVTKYVFIKRKRLLHSVNEKELFVIKV